MPTKDDPSLAQIASQLGDCLAKGITLGQLQGLTDAECEALYTLGYQHYIHKRYSEAARVFSLLLMNDHLEQRYAMAFASSLHMSGHYLEAITYYSLASVMDMGDPVPTFHTSECLRAMGHTEDAKEGLRMVIRQCEGEQRAALRGRAQALLDLMQGTQP